MFIYVLYGSTTLGIRFLGELGICLYVSSKINNGEEFGERARFYFDDK